VKKLEIIILSFVDFFFVEAGARRLFDDALPASDAKFPSVGYKTNHQNKPKCFCANNFRRREQKSGLVCAQILVVQQIQKTPLFTKQTRIKSAP
jgi:hypothetical protein